VKLHELRPILIIGAHRSGTTATARALELSGLHIGQDLDSHREPYELQRVHEEYLRRLGAHWYEPAALVDALATPEGLAGCVDYLREKVERSFGSLFGYRRNPQGLALRVQLFFGAAWGWKEPRTTLFAPAWLKIFPEARLVHVVRDRVAAAASIRERELRFQAAGDLPSGRIADLNHGIELVRAYVRAGELLNSSQNYRMVHFEHLQAAPMPTLRDLAEFSGLRPTQTQLDNAAATIRPPPSPTSG
jgi:hypothetical protein